ncbi:MAG: hypothetical protein ACJA0P_001418 [Planctomycetota bacterium]|jgi:hypothetical protein
MLTAPAVSPGTALVSAAQKVDHNKFRLEFDQAVKLGSKKTMDKLVQRMQTEAVFAIIETGDAISNFPNDVLYDRFNGLRDSWRRLYDNDFPDQIELYYVNLTLADKKIRRRIKTQYEKLNKPRVAAEQAMDSAALMALSLQYEAVADQFQTMGDQWFESDARIVAGAIADEFYQKKKTDLNRIATLYERALALRDELGVKDFTYKSTYPRMKSLVGQGFGSGASAEPAAGAGPLMDNPKDNPDGTAAPAGEIKTAKMTFEEFSGLKDVERPNFYLDEHRQIWPAIQLGGVGDVKDIPRLGDNSPRIMRIGDSKVGVDLDRDGTSDMDWPTRGKLDTVVMEIGDGATKRNWAVQAEVGRTQDFYQGLTLNLAQTDSQLTLYYIPGGEMVGEIDGVKIELFDDNMDGVYGSAPSSWAHRELRPGVSQPELDSIRVGGAKKAQPMSQYVELGKAGWHKLEVLNAGNDVTAEPVNFKTGTIQLKSKGVKPDFLILKGNGGILGETYIDISGGKKVEVPIGRWDLFYGLLRKGKKMQMVKAMILPSDNTPAYTVTEGETTIVTLGAPFTFDFEVSRDGDKATFKGMSLQVRGAGGEAYDRFYGAVPSPEASIRKTGSKRSYASEKARPGLSQDDIAKYGWHQCWKPLDVIFDVRGENIEIQLVEKKNKLFGSVESDWL